MHRPVQIGILVLAMCGSATASGFECAEPVRSGELLVGLDEAETAYAEIDDDGFRDAVNELAGVLLPCMGEPLSSVDSARYHRVIGIHLYTVGDEAGAELAMKAARELDPDAPLSEELVPEGHQLRTWYDGEALVASATRRAPEPRSGSLVFDGDNSRLRPVQRPTIAQVLDGAGFAVHTSYVSPREPLPEYIAIPRKRNTLLVCAGVGGSLGLATLTSSWMQRASLTADAEDGVGTEKEFDSRRAQLNAFALTGGTLLSAGTACGAGALWVGQR